MIESNQKSLGLGRLLSRRTRRERVRRQRTRWRQFETLENRLVLASDWQNPFVSRDASGDGVVVPQDILVIINEINQRTVSNPVDGSLPPRSEHPNAPYWSTNGDNFVTPTDILVIVNALNADVTSPTIAVQLVQDTAPLGATNNDLVTADARLTGMASDNLTGLSGLRAQVDGGPLVPVTMEKNGTFAFTPTLGADGEHTVRFTVSDGRLQQGATEFTFTLDTHAPDSMVIDLAPESDSAPMGDRRTTAGTVSVLGKTLASALVRLPGLGQATTANANGDFRFDNVPLVLGSNMLEAEVIDTAGNVASFSEQLFRDSEQPAILQLSEGDDLVVEGRIPVELGQASGTRHVRIELAASFDQSDQAALVEDKLLVYLVDTQFTNEPVVDRALFAWSSGRAEYIPGEVLFDGKTVDIDVTQFGYLTGGELLFQLVNLDRDTSTQIQVFRVDNVVDPQGQSSPPFAVTPAIASVGGPLDTSTLTPSGAIDVQLTNVRMNSSTGRYVADLALKNRGAAVGRTAVIEFPDLPAGVEVPGASGVNSAGDPYLNLTPAMRAGGLDTDRTSQRVPFEFSDPSLIQFPLTARVLTGPPNRAPVIDPIGPLTVMPGGVLEVPLTATDPDGDPVTFSIRMADGLPHMTLQGNGKLVVRPEPDETGSYVLDVFADDGAVRATRQVTLNVVADSETTTRISGRVLRTDGLPLAGMRVDIGAVQGLTSEDGSFELDLGSGNVVGDTIKVRGELYPGPDAYPFIAEKTAFLLDHPVFTGVNNVISRPIYLPILDVASGAAIDPMQDTMVTTDQIPGASVFVAAGTLMNQQGTPFTGVLSMTEVPRELTPAALPDNLMPDLVVTIQPGEMVFAAPAPLTLPNRSNFPPYTEMDLWSINPVTGEFDLVGLGRVSPDGSVIETIAGGIRNSSWHEFSPSQGQVTDLTVDAKCKKCKSTVDLSPTSSLIRRPEPPNFIPASRNLDEPPPPCCAGQQQPRPKSELDQGNLLLPLPLFAYQSCDAVRGVTLEYDSLRADPRPILGASIRYTSPGDTEVTDPFDQKRIVASASVSRGGFSQQLPGDAAGQSYWQLNSTDSIVALQSDLRSQPSGVYTYALDAGIQQLFGDTTSGSTTRLTGSLLHVNSVDSIFGRGWGFAGLQELVIESDGSVLQVDGNGEEDLYSMDHAAQVLRSPVGEFSTMAKQPDGRYIRTTTTRDQFVFSTSGKLERVTQSTGQETRFLYDDQNRLIRIIDPAGLATNFTYDGAHVSEILDPGGRVTRLDHDAFGFLTRVTYADGTQTSFQYNQRGLMTRIVDAEGNSTQIEYGEEGRVSQVTLADGSAHLVAPAVTRGISTGSNTDPLAAVPAVGGQTREARTVDRNGNMTVATLDRAGQLVQSQDSLGQITTIRRNADNLVRSVEDARGQVTTYSYDAFGNVTRVQDAISSNLDTYGRLFDDSHFNATATIGEIQVADLNQDGLNDIIYPAASSTSFGLEAPTFGMAVLFGAPTGTPSNRVYYQLAEKSNVTSGITGFPFVFANPWTISDLDADGDLDLLFAAADANVPELQVLSNDGHGTLVPSGTIPLGTGAKPNHLVTDDINHDGHQDVVIADWGRARLLVLMGNGQGGFAAPLETQLPAPASTLAIGDVDEDEVPDLVYGTFNRSLSLGVRLGNGDGTWQDPLVVAAGLEVTTLVLDNLDGDTHLDIAVTMESEPVIGRHLQVYKGNGQGGFSPQSFLDPSQDSFGLDPFWMGAADLNGDGRRDLIVRTDEADLVAVLINQGQGTFVNASQIVLTSNGGAGLGDVDKDGRIDLLTSDSLFGATSTPQVSTNLTVRHGNDNGTFGDQQITDLGASTTAMVSGDVNNDTFPDVLVAYGPANHASSRSVQVLLGDGSGQFQEGPRIPAWVTNLDGMKLIDVNRDQVLDLVVDVESAPQLEIYLGDGNGDFAFSQSLPLERGFQTRTRFDLGDIDGDQDLDLATMEGDGVVLWRNNGQGVFENRESLAGLPFRPVAPLNDDIEFGDLNGDGKEEIIAHSTTLFYVYSGTAGPIQAPRALLENQSQSDRFELVDIDGDSRLDIVQDLGPVLLGRGDGTFRNGPAAPRTVAFRFTTGDVNGDGLPDIISLQAGRVVININAGAGDFREFSYAGGGNVALLAVGDIDQNGTLDTLVLDQTTGKLQSKLNRAKELKISAGALYAYDATFSQPTSMRDEEGRQTFYTIDPQTGNRLTATRVAGQVGGADDSRTTYTYTPLGLVDTITDALGRVTDYDYNSVCRVQTVTYAKGTPDETTQHFGYDAIGNLTQITDENGHVTTHEYDLMSRLLRSTLPDPDGAGPLQSPVVSFGYDHTGNLIAMTDANGGVTQYEYDELNRLASLTNEVGSESHYTYDAAGNLAAVTDALGRRSQFTYDDRNRLIQVVDAAGGITKWTYDLDDNVTSVTDPLGRTTTSQYDERSRLIATTDAAGAIQRFSYDATDQLVSQTDRNGRTTSFTYDDFQRLIVSTDALGQTMNYFYDLADNLIVARDELGRATQYEYDNRDRLLQTIDPMGGTLGFSYDGVGNLLSTTDELGRTTSFDYDSLDRLVQTTDARSGTTKNTFDSVGNLTSATDELGRTTSYDYDLANRLTRSTDPLGGVEQWQYDAVDNVIRMTDRLGRVTQFSYDVLDRPVRVVDAEGGVSTSEYDLVDNLMAVTDELGRTTRFQYDVLNRLRQTTDPLGGIMAYQYDAVGNLVSSTDELGRVTRFLYDRLDRLKKTTDPLGGTMEYAYNAVGSLISETDELGRLTQYVYDPLNRLIGTVDALGQTATMAYDATGNLTKQKDELGQETAYRYDNLNRLTDVTDALGGQSQYVYDAVDNVTSMADELGHATQFRYDALNRLTRTTDALGFESDYAYDAEGNLKRLKDALGRETSYGYDGLNRLVKMTDALGATAEYTYDAVSNMRSFTDRLGRVTQYQYDRLDRLTSTIDPLDQTASLAYDVVDNLIEQTDELGRKTLFAYDDLNRLAEITDALGGKIRYAYDAVDNVISATDQLGHATEFAYDPLNRPTVVTNALDFQTRYSYDAVGNLKRSTDALGRETLYGYDALNRLVTLMDPLGKMEEYSYDAASNLRSTTDRIGRTTQYRYDSLNRMTEMTDALGGKVAYTFDGVGNATSVTDQLDRQSQFTYDGLNRLTFSRDPLGFTTSYSYDPQGNLASTRDALGRVTAFEYDKLDRLIKSTDALGGIQSNTFDAVGNLVASSDELGRTTTVFYDDLNRTTAIKDPLGNTTSFGYDAVGNQLSVTDPLSHVTTYAYDAINRLVNTVDPLGAVTRYSYDGVNNLLTLTDPVGNVTRYDYDALDRVTNETNALDLVRTYEYDAEGNLVEMTDRNDRTRRYTYDGLNRRVREEWLDGARNPIHTFSYDYDAASQLLTASDPDSSYTFTYDNDGRATSVSNVGTPGVPEVVFAYAYDEVHNRLSRRETIGGNDGGTNSYSYDVLDRMTRVTQAGPGVAEKRVDLAYDAASQMTGTMRFADLAGTQFVAASEYGYDTAGRLTSLRHHQGTTDLAVYGWTFDAASRITRMTTPDGMADYSYDDRDQLLGADHTTQADEAYSYDANGNRTLTGYSTGENNQLLSDGTFNYTYDGEGNRLTRTETATGAVTEYEWDYRNRLARVVVKDSGGAVTMEASYRYDVFDLRIGKLVDADGAGPEVAEATHFVLDGDHIALQFDGEGELTHRYLHGPLVDQVLADENATGQVLWPLTDHLGTVRDLVDSTGALINHLVYDNYGQLLSETNATVDHLFGYTGRELDDETGLYYYRARYYDSIVGRFISEDPISFAAGDHNLNRYVENMPNAITDPSGLAAVADTLGSTLSTLSLLRGLGLLDDPLLNPLLDLYKYLSDHQNDKADNDDQDGQGDCEDDDSEKKKKTEDDPLKDAEPSFDPRTLPPSLQGPSGSSGSFGAPLKVRYGQEMDNTRPPLPPMGTNFKLRIEKGGFGGAPYSSFGPGSSENRRNPEVDIHQNPHQGIADPRIRLAGEIIIFILAHKVSNSAWGPLPAPKTVTRSTKAQVAAELHRQMIEEVESVGERVLVLPKTTTTPRQIPPIPQPVLTPNTTSGFINDSIPAIKRGGYPPTVIKAIQEIADRLYQKQITPEEADKMITNLLRESRANAPKSIATPSPRPIPSNQPTPPRSVVNPRTTEQTVVNPPATEQTVVNSPTSNGQPTPVQSPLENHVFDHDRFAREFQYKLEYHRMHGRFPE